MTTYYAAIKWPVAEGPSPSDVANDLQILAMTLIAEHGWTLESVEAMMVDATAAAEEQQWELHDRQRGYDDGYAGRPAASSLAVYQAGWRRGREAREGNDAA